MAWTSAFQQCALALEPAGCRNRLGARCVFWVFDTGWPNSIGCWRSNCDARERASRHREHLSHQSRHIRAGLLRGLPIRALGCRYGRPPCASCTTSNTCFAQCARCRTHPLVATCPEHGQTLVDRPGVVRDRIWLAGLRAFDLGLDLARQTETPTAPDASSTSDVTKKEPQGSFFY